MMNFGQKVEERGDLIPANTLLNLRATYRGMKNSKQTNGRMVDLEFTVAEGQPFAGRKLWDMIMDPTDLTNSVEARDMGTGKIRRILEGVWGAHPSQPNSYGLPSYDALGGQHLIPVLIGIQPGKDGYEDKNSIDYLSPHSSVKKIVECFNLLKQGVFKWEKVGGKPAAAPAQQGGFAMASPPAAQPNMFAAQPAAAAPAGPGWLAPAGNVPAAPVTPPQQAPAAQPGPAAPATAYPSNTAPAAGGGYGAMAPATDATPPAGFTPPTQPPVTATAAVGELPQQGFATPAATPEAAAQGFTQPQGQQPGFAAPVAGQTPPLTNSAPATTAGSPSNGWQAPATTPPAQLPQG